MRFDVKALVHDDNFSVFKGNLFEIIDFFFFETIDDYKASSINIYDIYR
jgi:hypothetical protein